MAGESRSRRITTVRLRGDRLYAGRRGRRPAVEEPLDLRLRGMHLETLLRTPGHDIELAHGHLFAAGTITGREDVGEARYCDGAVTVAETGLAQNTYNVLDVAVRDLAAGFVVPSPGLGLGLGPDGSEVAGRSASSDRPAPTEDPERAITGEQSIADVLIRRPDPLGATPSQDPAVLFAGARALLASGTDDQARTRGLLLDARGEALASREDVHPENLVDKLVGWALLAGQLPLSGAALVLTGPVGFGVVRRAFLAGAPVVAATGPATSLALDAAEAFGITLVTALAKGADGDAHAEVLTHPERLDLTQAR
ncbi:formate dehydrogenase accessory sulfurtransferase FdhD [Brachybacterium sp. AOP25-B2-12]|uniref:formate dehydrogenase accessory sulfurtransferase FdhD n=1 Tax=Brachybacterium sp. AOP25-B2-12 TaxID=3457710 RepID=UPI004033E6F8